MGITTKQFNNILENIFSAGRTIKLYSSMPTKADGSGGVTIDADYAKHVIESGDFETKDGVVTSTKNMLFDLAELDEGVVTKAPGFGVFDNANDVLYFGEFVNEMNITRNTVPTIKKYDEDAGEGIKITMESTEKSATTE